MIYPNSANTYGPSQKPVNALSVRLRQHVATTVSCQKDSSRSPHTTPTQTAYAWSDSMARSCENWGASSKLHGGNRRRQRYTAWRIPCFLFIQTTLENRKVSSNEILNRPGYVILENVQSHYYWWEWNFISFHLYGNYISLKILTLPWMFKEIRPWRKERQLLEYGLGFRTLKPH